MSVKPLGFAVASYVPSVTGTLSVIGSTAIMLSIWQERKTKLRNPQHRILFVMSFLDILYSTNKALNWLTYPADMNLLGAQGNEKTCAVQGFFTEVGYAAAMYNAVLSIYYCMTVGGMRQADFARNVEPWLHAFVNLLFLGFGIAGVIMGLFNPVGPFCYVGPYPLGCPTFRECERYGETFPIYYEIFGQMWVQLAYVIILYCNGKIWYKIYSQERLIEKRYGKKSIMQKAPSTTTFSTPAYAVKRNSTRSRANNTMVSSPDTTTENIEEPSRIDHRDKHQLTFQQDVSLTSEFNCDKPPMLAVSEAHHNTASCNADADDDNGYQSPHNSASFNADNDNWYQSQHNTKSCNADDDNWYQSPMLAVSEAHYNKATEAFRKKKKSNRFERSKQVAIQSFLFVGAFFLSWSFVTIYHIITWVKGIRVFWALPIANTFLPLQGFFNAFIYARPRYRQIVQKEGKLGFCRTIRLVFFPSVTTQSWGKTSKASTSGSFASFASSRRSSIASVFWIGQSNQMPIFESSKLSSQCSSNRSEMNDSDVMILYDEDEEDEDEEDEDEEDEDEENEKREEQEEAPSNEKKTVISYAEDIEHQNKQEQEQIQRQGEDNHQLHHDGKNLDCASNYKVASPDTYAPTYPSLTTISNNQGVENNKISMHLVQQDDGNCDSADSKGDNLDEDFDFKEYDSDNDATEHV